MTSQHCILRPETDDTTTRQSYYTPGEWRHSIAITRYMKTIHHIRQNRLSANIAHWLMLLHQQQDSTQCSLLSRLVPSEDGVFGSQSFASVIICIALTNHSPTSQQPPHCIRLSNNVEIIYRSSWRQCDYSQCPWYSTGIKFNDVTPMCNYELVNEQRATTEEHIASFDTCHVLPGIQRF